MMRLKLSRISVITAVLLFGSALLPATARAALSPAADWIDTIQTRQTRFHQTPWRQTGHMAWQPYIAAEVGSTDNIRASRSQRLSDQFTRMTPALLFRTDSSERGFSGSMQTEWVQFNRYSAQNQLNAALRLAPYTRFSDNWRLTGTTHIALDHELSSAESTQPLANEPIPYQQTDLGLTLWHTPHRVTQQFFVNYTKLSFDNTNLITGQPQINNDRNRTEWTAGVRVGLQNAAHDTEISWKNEILQHDFHRRDFNVATFSYTGLDRDSQGWRSQISFRYEPMSLWRFTLATGLEHKHFATVRSRTLPIAHFKGTYLITPLTNIHLGFDRTVNITAFDNAPAYTANQTQIGLTHELTRKIVLGLTAQHTITDYWDNSRHDTLYDGGVHINYQQNRHLKWQTSYHYQRRQSRFSLADFHENRILFGAKVTF